MNQSQPKKLILLACLLSASALYSSRAGQVTYDFTTDPTTQATNPIQVFQNGFADSNGTSIYWKSDGGNPGGFLGITWPLGSSTTIAVFPDIDQGGIVTAFTFECDLRIGNPNQNVRPADGFSINFARANDPVFENPDASSFATSGAVETGTTTGLAICFDTWAGNTLPDGADIEGIIVRVDNKTILRQAMPTRNGECADDTSLQTGPRNAAYWTTANNEGTMPDAAFEAASWDQLCWQPLRVELDDQSKLTVSYKGRVLLDHYQTTFFPSAGGIILAGRTGNADEHTHFDNLKLTTSATPPDNEKPTTPSNLRVTETGAYRVVLAWDASTDNSGRVGYEIEQNGTQLPDQYVQTTQEVRGLSATTAYTFRVRATDVSGNKSDWVSVDVTTAADIDDPNFAAAKIYGTTDLPISGTLVDDLLFDARYPNSPDRTGRLNGMVMSFGDPNFGDTFGENLGVRIAGTVTPPETGQYRFFIRSDDGSQLYLNSSGPSVPVADGFSFIATETDCCDAFVEPGTFNDDGTTSPTSEPVSLTAGTKYGILFLVKEGGGGDWGQVAWRKEGDTTAAGSLPPISAPAFESETIAKVDPVGASVAITQQPQSATVTANEPSSVSVQADWTSPYASAPIYQWFKDGVAIPGANTPSLSWQYTPESLNGAKYKVSVTVPGKSVTSDEATLTVNADNKPPSVVSTTGSDTFTQVTLIFSEPLTDATATAAANYSINGGVTVSAAQLLNPTTVRLTTSAQAKNTPYTVSISNVADSVGNAVPAGTSASFTSFADRPGEVRELFYTGIGGGVAVADLTSASKFPGAPDEVRYSKTLESPDGYGDNYGVMIRGYIMPTTTANYYFFIRSDDASALYLNRTGDLPPDPTSATPIAEETGCCNAFLEVGSPQTSAEAIPMTAGTKYGFTVLMKEGGGGDYVQVAWRKDTEGTDPATLTPIGTEFIGSYAPPTPVGGGSISNFALSADKQSLTITYTGTLESADSVAGPWTPVANATSPATVPVTGAAKFFRVQ